MKPNAAQLLSLLRTLLQILGTALVSHGTLGINGQMWEQISGGIIMIAPVAWAMFAHTDDQALKTVEAMPSVAKIVPAATTVTTGSAVEAALIDPDRPKVVTA